MARILFDNEAVENFSTIYDLSDYMVQTGRVVQDIILSGDEDEDIREHFNVVFVTRSMGEKNRGKKDIIYILKEVSFRDLCKRIDEGYEIQSITY